MLYRGPIKFVPDYQAPFSIECETEPDIFSCSFVVMGLCNCRQTINFVVNTRIRTMSGAMIDRVYVL